MARGSKPSFVRRLLEMRLFLVVNVLVLLFLALAFGKEFARNWTIQQEIQALQEQADSLQARNLEIRDLTRVIQTESFVEREARLKLGMSKPGESVVVIEPDSAGATVEQKEEVAQALSALSAPAPTQTTLAIANHQKWWYYFFDRPKFDALKSYESIP